jgi:hypothetical protein
MDHSCWNCGSLSHVRAKCPVPITNESSKLKKQCRKIHYEVKPEEQANSMYNFTMKLNEKERIMREPPVPVSYVHVAQ